jgi:hypothetical protein
MNAFALLYLTLVTASCVGLLADSLTHRAKPKR